ncbi:MAG: hypothetical protein ACR2IF_07195 [Terriglobales bacterium]
MIRNRSLVCMALGVVSFCSFVVAQAPPPPPPVHVPQIQAPQVPSQIHISDIKVPPTKAEDLPHVDTPQTAHVALTPEAARAIAAPIFRASVRAEPEMYDRAVYLRRECTRLHQEIRELGFEIPGISAADIARRDNRDVEPEWKWQQAREDMGRWLRCKKELEGLTHDDERARQREQAYVNNLRVETSGNYAVNHSDSTATSAPQIHCEDEITYTYEKVPVSAGFDSNGKPVYRMGWDVVPHKKRTCR